MNTVESKACRPGEFREIAKQAEVELAILLGIEQSLHLVLDWMTRDRGIGHKLSTLRFAARTFERHLTRTRVLADYGGYMHLITDANPHLASDVRALSAECESLQVSFERIMLRLEYVSPDEALAFGGVCTDLECHLEQVATHGKKEMELLQHSFVQEQGGSG